MFIKKGNSKNQDFESTLRPFVGAIAPLLRLQQFVLERSKIKLRRSEVKDHLFRNECRINAGSRRNVNALELLIYLFHATWVSLGISQYTSLSLRSSIFNKQPSEISISKIFPMNPNRALGYQSLRVGNDCFWRTCEEVYVLVSGSTT